MESNVDTIDYLGMAEVLLETLQSHHPEYLITLNPEDHNAKYVSEELSKMEDEAMVLEFMQSAVGQGMLLGMIISAECFYYAEEE